MKTALTLAATVMAASTFVGCSTESEKARTDISQPAPQITHEAQPAPHELPCKPRNSCMR